MWENEIFYSFVQYKSGRAVRSEAILKGKNHYRVGAASQAVSPTR